MKVLKIGALPGPPPKPWPIGVEIVCLGCACWFVLETEADYTIRRCTARIYCPTCDRAVMLSRPLWLWPLWLWHLFSEGLL